MADLANIVIIHVKAHSTWEDDGLHPISTWEEVDCQCREEGLVKE